MPLAARLGDSALCAADFHSPPCPLCPHPTSGPAIAGSPNVNVNRLPALRVGDPGVHATCCNSNTWTVVMGSGTVKVNSRPMARQGDKTRHCGGNGALIVGSPNVKVGG